MESPCFICGSLVGGDGGKRRRRREVLASRDEKMGKLISMRRTVEHSSNFISDVLCRILKETVLRQETICRICFKLLDDIDFHIKEVQEKTECITSKFLDKEEKAKEESFPSSVEDDEVMEDQRQNSTHPRSRRRVCSSTKKFPTATTNNSRNKKKKVVRLGGGQDKSKGEQLETCYETDTTLLTEDEMSVNVIGRNKAKLFSHILNPGKGNKSQQQKDICQEGKTLSPLSSSALVIGGATSSRYSSSTSRTCESPSKRLKNGSTDTDDCSPTSASRNSIKRKRSSLSGKHHGKKQPQSEEFVTTTTDDDDDDDDDEEEEEIVERRKLKPFGLTAAKQKDKTVLRDLENVLPKNKASATTPSPPSTVASSSTTKSKPAALAVNNELVTVNMDELGDLFSKPKVVYYGKKSLVVQAIDDGPTHSNLVSSRPSNENVVANEDSPSRVLVDKVASPVCKICCKTFKRDSNLQLHLEKIHGINVIPQVAAATSIPETHRCDVCTREFTNEKSLESHKKEHLRQSCGSRENNVIDMAMEAKTATKKTDIQVKGAASGKNSAPKATCHICQQTFKRAFNMRIHIDRVHNKVKPFPCDICNKSFATNSDLNQHKITHGQGKLFACELCGREFGSRDSIILHRKQHENRKTHFCSVCNKGFYKQSCLSRHIRSHTGERPYVCKTCNMSFSQSSSRKAHLKRCGGGVTVTEAGSDRRDDIHNKEPQPMVSAQLATDQLRNG